jgi:hypothetical protein
VLSASCCHFSGYFMLGYTALWLEIIAK